MFYFDPYNLQQPERFKLQTTPAPYESLLGNKFAAESLSDVKSIHLHRSASSDDIPDELKFIGENEQEKSEKVHSHVFCDQ